MRCSHSHHCLASDNVPEDSKPKPVQTSVPEELPKPAAPQPAPERPKIKRPETPDPGMSFHRITDGFLSNGNLLGCEIVETCSDDSVPYKVVSGDGLEKYPMICFNNKL